MYSMTATTELAATAPSLPAATTHSAPNATAASSSSSSSSPLLLVLLLLLLLLPATSPLCERSKKGRQTWRVANFHRFPFLLSPLSYCRPTTLPSNAEGSSASEWSAGRRRYR